MDDVKRYMAAHLDALDGPRSVADALGMPYDALRRRFRVVEGRPLGTYLRQLRLARVRGLLAETDRPCAAIAREAGFASVEAAARAFKREMGLTMQEYRRLCRLTAMW